MWVLGRMSLLRMSVIEKRIPVLPVFSERMAVFCMVKPVRKKSLVLFGYIWKGRFWWSKYSTWKLSAFGPQLALVPVVAVFEYWPP